MISLMKRNNKNIFPLLVLSNLFPLLGVMREGWPFFLVLYVFWLEMLIITFFEEIKMIVSRAGEHGWEKLRLMFFYGLVRGGIFCFYLIFIIVFIGLLGTSKEQHITVIKALIFRNTILNIAILNFIAYNLIDFIFNFILNKKYLKSKASDHNNIIDGRQVIVHIVVVLGAFLSNFILARSGNNYYYSNLGLVTLFIFVKIIGDFFSTANSEEDSPEVYI